MLRRLLVILAAATLVVPGCGGGSAEKTGEAPDAAQDDRGAWAEDAQAWSGDLRSAMQSLATAAETDAASGLAALGPLAYCSENLQAIGLPPAGFELSHGSFKEACERFESAARLYQAGVEDDSQISFNASVHQMELAIDAMQRGVDRLETATAGAGPDEASVAETQSWAANANEWARDIEYNLEDMQAKIESSADPVADLWAEHSGGTVTTFSFCADNLARAAGSPPTDEARRIYDRLQAVCGNFERALDSLATSEGQAMFQEAVDEFAAAVTDLRRYAP